MAHASALCAHQETVNGYLRITAGIEKTGVFRVISVKQKLLFKAVVISIGCDQILVSVKESSMSVTVLDLPQFKEKVVSQYTDVIGKKVGGEILGFSDEWFAAASNLIEPKDPIRDATKFTYAGAWYDGWETRRHNVEEADWVTFKMGVSSAKIIGCEVDTAFFNGNHAPHISVEATNDEHLNNWTTVIGKVECGPSQRHFFIRSDGLTEESFKFVRLKMYPDGGIARFRLYGQVIPVFTTASLSQSLDYASVLNGGVAISYSDQHFGTADNLLLPGRGHDMSDGWETKRSRTPGHVDWVIIKLGATIKIDEIVVDTAHFRGNFPQSIKVSGIKSDSDPSYDAKWESLVPVTKAQADKEHFFKDLENSDKEFTHVLLTIIPDGGVKRVRVFGKRV